MTAVGLSRRFWHVRCTSAYPPLATEERTLNRQLRARNGHFALLFNAEPKRKKGAHLSHGLPLSFLVGNFLTDLGGS
jgi:hypothetical protein